VEAFPLEKKTVIIGESSEKGVQSPLFVAGIRRDLSLYTFCLKIGKILEDPVSARCNFLSLNEKKYFHAKSISMILGISRRA